MANVKRPLSALAVSLAGWASLQSAQAQYFEGTVLPYLEGIGLEVSHDGPRSVSGGQRWENLTLTDGEADVEFRLDWVEEVATEAGLRIRFSPDGAVAEAADSDPVRADIRLDDVIWDIEMEGSREAHVVSGALAELRFDDVEEGSARLFSRRFEVAAEIDRAEMVTVVTNAQIDAIGATVEAFEGPDNRLDVAARNIALRHESEVPQAVFEAWNREDAGDAPDLDAIKEVFEARFASTFAIGEVAVLGEFTDLEDGAPGSFEMLMGNLTGTMRSGGSAEFEIAGELQMDGLEARLDAENAAGEFEMEAISAGLDLALDSGYFEGMIDEVEAGENPEPGPEIMSAIRARYELRSGGGSGSFSFDEDGMRGEGRFEAGGGRELLAFENGELIVDAHTNGFEVEGTVPMISPQPFSLSLGEGSYLLRFPFMPAPDGGLSTVALRFALRDLVGSESLWAMADPGAQIPRDPITLVIDMEAAVRILQPIFGDIEPDEAMEVAEVLLTELTLRGGGAEILGEGSAAIDMSGPRPVGDGQVDLSIKGLIALSGAVAKLGLVPPEALFGLRGALGAFATPVGEDVYTSQIILTPDGKVTANGLPLPLD